MADLLALSSRILDEGLADVINNRITQELSEVGDGIAVVESFSHSVLFDTGDSLVVFDASGVFTGAHVVEAIRGWSSKPISSLVYTHGHADHIGGSGAFIADAAQRGHPRIRVVAHEAVNDRLARYGRTDHWNQAINARQFGASRASVFSIGDQGRRFIPDDVARPDLTYGQTMTMTSGDLTFELNHGRGETDDHTWAWIPEYRAIACGDFLIWCFPNAGNPQKVQRYPDEWARALRTMLTRQPELLLPAHGLPITGAARISQVLTTVAETLESLVDQVVSLMNEGASLNTIIHTVKVPAEVLALPFMRPLYDEPEFVVRNVWRLYGGWWDGDPARLQPPKDNDLAREVAGLAGGVDALVTRAQDLAAEGDLRNACQLIEWASLVSPDSLDVHEARRRIFTERRDRATSVMAKGIFGGAAQESADALDGSH